MDAGAVRQLEANGRGRDFVIGDLHGALSCLERALAGVNFDPVADRLISVGDLIDRGPENEACLQLLNEPWFHSVLGNHELMMAQFYHGGPYGPYWVRNGGRWGLEHSAEDDEVLHLAERCTQLPLLLTVSMVDGRKFHVLHAELFSPTPLTDEDLAGSERLRASALAQASDGAHIIWGRFIFNELYRVELDEHLAQKWERGARINKRGALFGPNLSHIYSGHTIVTRPTRFCGQTNLDTGAFLAYEARGPAWAGLTITEPLTDRFWRASPTSFAEVTPLTLHH